MSNRVVDELNPDMLLTRKDLAVLLDYKDEEAPPPDTRFFKTHNWSLPELDVFKNVFF